MKIDVIKTYSLIELSPQEMSAIIMGLEMIRNHPDIINSIREKATEMYARLNTK